MVNDLIDKTRNTIKNTFKSKNKYDYKVMGWMFISGCVITLSQLT